MTFKILILHTQGYPQRMRPHGEDCIQTLYRLFNFIHDSQQL